MPQLKRTTVEKDHYHVVYIRDDGTGITSPNEDDGHVHLVTLVPATPPQMDPLGNIISEGTPERLEMSEYDGHSHSVIDIVFEEPKDDKVKGKDDVLINEVRVLFKQAKTIERDFRKRGNTSYKFYIGEQWEEADRQALEAAKRACLTVNEIRPIVQVLSGHQRQNRTDIKTFPIEDADPRGAELCNIIIKHVLDYANYEQHESKVFMDQVIVGRGIFDVYVTFDQSQEGDIRVVRYNWNDIFFGPHDYEDASDLEYLVKTKWYSKAELESMYPDKADDLMADMKDAEERNPHVNVPGDQYDADNKSIMPVEINGEPIVNIENKSFRILELWRKRYREVKVLINIEDSENEFIYDKSAILSKEDLKKASNIEGFDVRNVPKWNMEVVTIAGNTVLDKRVSALKDFNVVPVYASKEDDYVQGKVEPLIDLQKEINKRHSQAIDVVNNANNDGWFYDDDTFVSREEEQAFKDSCNTPGWAVKVQNVNKIPIKIERGRFPTELVNMRELSSAKMREIAGITNEVLGLESNAKSGVAIARRLRQGLTTNDYLFDNLSLAKKKLGRILIKMIQDVFTVDRVMKILHDQNAIEPFEITNQEGQRQSFSEIDKEVVRSFLENVDFYKYDVSVSDSANSPTKNIDRLRS